MSETALVGWIVIAFLGVMTPGIDTMLVLRHTVFGGQLAGIRVVVGIALGCLVWAAASLAGLTALLAASHVIYDVVRVAGAAYLIWLGASAIWRTLPRNRQHEADVENTSVLDGIAPTRGLRTGLITNLLNPKVGVFYISLLPQFLPVGPSATVWGALLVAIHLATTFLWYPALILAVGYVRRALMRPTVRRWLDRVTATVLITLGLRLAAEVRQ